MSNCNLDIREYAEENGVNLWQIAHALGINDGNFSRKLRFELSQNEKARIRLIIEGLAVINHANEAADNTALTSDADEESAKVVFRRRLRAVLSEKGISQARLASALGTTPQAISSYTRGKTVPDYDTLCRISDILQVSIDYLLKARKELRIEHED